MNDNQANRYTKRKFSVEEKRNYCIAWEKSELNRIAFCKAHGISRSALYQWTKEFKKDNGDFGFSPLIIDKKTSEKPTDMIQITVAFTNNSLQLSIAMPEHRLVSFIQEMSDATPAIR